VKVSNPRFDALVTGLRDWGVQDLVYVPSSHSAPVIRGLARAGVRAVMANREEEAVGIAGGLSLAGRRAVIVMQDNGFGNALTALATFAGAYHVPLPVFANGRGGPGEYNAMIHGISEAVPALLRAIGVRVEELTPSQSPEAWRMSASAAAELAWMQHRPVVTLFEALHPALALGGAR
jgi:sulfopyruvate decarboxylase subunit alpha